jgi:hypothetical protein
MRERLAQGTSRIIRAKDVTDGSGMALSMDGWSVIAYAAAETVGGPLLQVWSSASNRPSGVGVATASGRDVQIFVQPDQTNFWDCDRVVVQAYITSPDGTQTERIINRTYDFDRRIAVPA